MKKNKTLLVAIVFLTILSFPFLTFGKELVITVWTGPEADNLYETVKEFEKDTGINVRVEEIARDAYRTKLTAVLMSGSSDWDVVYLMGEFLPEFTEAGALLPLDGVLSDSLISELMANAFEKGKWKGKLMGLVTNYHTNYYYYRKDLLKEAGFDQPAKTWDEYQKIAIALTKDLDGDGKIDQYGSVMRGATKKNSIHYEFANYFLGFGAKWLDKDFKPIMNSDDGVAALQYFVDLKNKYQVVPPDASAVGYLEKNQYFQTGKIAQTVQWSAAFKALFSPERSPKTYQQTGLAVLPGRKVGDKIIHGSLATHDSWVISKNSKNIEAAKEFIRWSASFKGSKVWAINGGEPLNVAAYSDPDVIKARPDFKVAGEANSYADVFPAIPETAELMKIWSEKLGYALAGEMTPKQALDQCAQEWTEILKEGGYF